MTDMTVVVHVLPQQTKSKAYLKAVRDALPYQCGPFTEPMFLHVLFMVPRTDVLTHTNWLPCGPDMLGMVEVLTEALRGRLWLSTNQLVDIRCQKVLVDRTKPAQVRLRFGTLDESDLETVLFRNGWGNVCF